MSNIDVVITGLGATTPLGGDVASTWDGLLDGRSGIRPIEADWVERFDLPVRIGATLAEDPAEKIPRVQARRLDRCEQVALIAARQAWADAGYTEPTEEHSDVDPERLGVSIGTGIGGPLTLLAQDDLLEEHGIRKVSPLTVPMLMPNGPAAHVAIGVERP
jgi:3-oxoacyl-[acyl-carrier-protein] synthase II